jgi:hypothetical protein
MKLAIEIVLMALPIVAAWVVGLRLLNYRRDHGAVPIGGLRGLRPDQYTDEGQRLLRWDWLLLVLTIPWWVAVFAVFGFP